jgi:hypothetical protein
MKTIIAGSREGIPYATVERAIVAFQREFGPITEVVCGMARGVDALGAYWADKNAVPIKPFPADWNANGKAAGPIRNRQMADYAEALCAIWDGVSRGTKNMIDEAKKRGLKVYVQHPKI